MFLGRSTQQWLGVIGATVSFLQIIVPQLAPDSDPVQVATILGAIGGFAGVLVIFVAQNYTTPLSDPVLPPGTPVTISTPSGQPNLTITLPSQAGEDATAEDK